MKSKYFQWVGIVFILQIGLIHIINAQAEYEEAAYMGFLFAANFFGCVVAAIAIYRQQMLGWILGLFIALGSVAGYFWSRTAGMPGMNVEEWIIPYGVVSLCLEGAFILLFLFRPWKIRKGELSAAVHSKLSTFFPAIGLLLIMTITGLTYRWDYDVTQAYGLHVGSVEQISETPVTSLANLEQKYGVEVSLVATSMMDSIVDVRIKIIDPDKAHNFLLNQAALFVNDQALILAPHMHSHAITRMKAGKIYTVFFPTQQIIHVGSEVSLVFGAVRTEPMVVQ